MMMKRSTLMMCVLSAACGEPGGGGGENEFISRVVLTFTPTSGAAAAFQFDDPDGDGGAAGTSEPITLTAATSYTLTVEFLNALETPPEDITLEVRDEGVEHQVFFTGTAVVGPASSTPSGPLTQSYSDMDAKGFPLGLTNTVTTVAGTGELIVTLRHMPPELPPAKAADSAAQVKAGGFAAIGGSTDAQVTFTVTVP